MEEIQIEKSITLNLLLIKSLDELYDELALQFGFPDYFGRNVDAVIDCLFGVRYPDEGMTQVTISLDGSLVLNIKNFSSGDQIIKETIIAIVEFVNYKYQFKGLKPAILLCLIK